VVNGNTALVHEQAQVTLAVARQAVVARAVVDTTQSIEHLISSADMRIASLPAGLQSRAQDLLQQLRSSSQALVGAELASGQNVALSQLQSTTYNLNQLLSASKGAQSEIENALLQVGHAQRELVAANYLVRTGDTLSGQTVDFLKKYWVNILGASAIGLELRSVLGNTAESLDAQAKKLEDAKTEKAEGREAQNTKQASNEEARSTTPYLNSKEVALQPYHETRQQVLNSTMYGGIDVPWAYYQKGGAAASAAESEEAARAAANQVINRPIFKSYAGEQQDKPAAPRFDYVKTKMPTTRMSADGPYLSTTAGLTYRPGMKGSASGSRGGSSTDPNSANSLMSKNYAFVVGPTQSASSSGNARYGGPTPGSEAAEKRTNDVVAAATTNNTTVQLPTAALAAAAAPSPRDPNGTVAVANT